MNDAQDDALTLLPIQHAVTGAQPYAFAVMHHERALCILPFDKLRAALADFSDQPNPLAAELRAIAEEMDEDARTRSIIYARYAARIRAVANRLEE